MKHVLILGATSDIANALAHKYASQGYHPILAARQSERLKEAATDIDIRYNVTTHIVEFDALDFASHQKIYASLPHKPDVAICVFGLLGDQSTGQSDFTHAKQIIDSNYTGAVSILEVIANDFEQKKSGAIVGISSVAGDRGRQSNYLYGSAKSAFTAYLSGLRNRLAKSNVSVLTVKPGFVHTKMTANLPLPAPVTGQPEQVAKDIFNAQQNGRHEIYTLWMWRYLMLIIRNIPEGIFKRMNL